MNMIDVFGVLPTRTLGRRELPNLPRTGPITNGIWLFRDRHGMRYVIARQGTVTSKGWSGCEKAIEYHEWVRGGRLNPCTGRPYQQA